MKKFSVMIADDEGMIRNHLAKKIANCSKNFQVVATAADGAELLELISSNPPDVVFTDIRMPAVDGLEVCRQINQHFPFIKTVIVSGYDDFEYAKKSIDNNVFAYLLKPTNSEELTSVLARLSVELGEKKVAVLSGLLNENSSKEEVGLLLKSYIKKNFSQEINFNMLATELHYSPSYLTKLFNQQTGLTPVKYLTKIRINAAQRLLCDPDISITDVGKLVGYPDPYYFSRIFKKQTKDSPLAWRKKNINMQKHRPD